MQLSLQKKLLQYIDEHLSSSLEDWRLFARQLKNSLQDNNREQISEMILSLLESRGMATRLLSKEVPLVYGELHAGAAHTLLLYTHHALFSSDLWNFATIAIHLAALDAYRAITGSLGVNIKWLLDGSENSIGHPNLKSIVAEHCTLLQADGCLWQGRGRTKDGTPLLAIGTKGLLRVELAVETTSCELHSMHGSIAPNALWRLLWALASLKNAHEEILLEGFYDTLTPTEDNLVELLHALPDDAQFLAQEWGLEQLLFGLKGFQLHYAQFLTPTCTINHIAGGKYPDDAHGTLPTQATAQIDFYLVPDQDPQDIFTKLQHHLKNLGFSDVQARMLYSNYPVQTPLTDPFVQIAQRAITSACGQKPSILPMTADSMPCYSFRQILDIPIVVGILGAPGLDHLTEQINISAQDFAAGIKQVTIMIEEMGNAT